MAVAEQVAIFQHPEETRDEEPLEDIAIQFSQLMHRRKHRKGQTKSPGLPHKAALGHIKADSEGGDDVSTEEEGAVALGNAGADPSTPERARLVSRGKGGEKPAAMPASCGCVPLKCI